ncbi:glycosyltransferase involved in cell wall biosynthesis [Roseimicrobium gellanilyticum]|uniref:Glycosyltransferase involved in cell wall biosynthesis n=2 Tax=Roseimicrobium gellanilyticum TaxID=748857 RepID=A0A366HQX3_9BACT|nr:glycosyltransferase involved in cell wall biosynthesis [Roseimicrobium gellanilyticum]
MAASVAAEGVEVSVATTIDRDEAARRNIQFGTPVHLDAWTCYFFPRHGRFYKPSLSLLKWLWQHMAEYDLVHIHAVFSFAPIAAWKAALHAGRPYIVSPHGLLNQWGMIHRRKHIKALSFRLIERPLLNAASAIHYTSDAEQQEASLLNLTARPLVIPLGIDMSAYVNLPDRQLFEARFPEAQNRQIVLFLSRIDPKKGIEVLLQAWRQLAPSHPNALLVIAGSGTVEYTSSLKAKAEELGIASKILWTGFLGHEEKRIALGSAEIFVLPSKSESFGIALLEAMAAGVPCVTTLGVALGAEASAVGAVQPADYEADSLAAAVGRLLDSAELRGRLGMAGREFATGKYSLEAMGHALKAAYLTLAVQSVATTPSV